MAFIFFAALLSPNTGFPGEMASDEIILPNGFRAIIIENRNAPVMASVVMAHIGSSRENFKTAGMSHMLEHLLFNGTGKRSQKELYEEQDFYGIYNNAHTTREYTNFMALAGKEHMDRALEIQSDMLFNSTLPVDKFEKEKGIVLNEIAMSMMKDGYLAEDHFNRKFFHGSPYNLPVLGLPETIQGMDRDTVYNFYKKHYAPNNMTAIVVGDFNRETMAAKIIRYFGGARPGLLPDPNAIPKWAPPAPGTFISRKKINKAIIHMGAPAPHVDHEDFFSYYLLIRLASMDLKKRINKVLMEPGGQGVLEASMGVDFKKGFSALLINITLSPGGDVNKTIEAAQKVMEQIPNRKFSPGEVKRIISSLKMDELSLRERVHYFGMMAAAKIAAGGWDFAKGYVDDLEKITPGMITDTAKKYFSDVSFLAAALVPGGEERKVSGEETREYFQEPEKECANSRESVELLKTWKASTVSSDPGFRKQETPDSGTSPPKKANLEITRKKLKNGLTVLTKRSAPGGIFAVHALIKNRSAMEPEGKEGIAELLHNLLDKGTVSRKGENLQNDLMDISAKIKTADNPYIPYDNYYFSPEYTYIRLETMEESYREALEILSDIIRNPLMDKEDVAKEKNRLMELVKDKKEDAADSSRKLLFKALLEDSEPVRPVRGAQKSLESITVVDLKRFHGKYFSPGNMIISMVSGLEEDIVMNEVGKRFSVMAAMGNSEPVSTSSPASNPVPRAKVIRQKLGKSQSYVRLGKVMEIAPGDLHVLPVLSALLSDTISFQLREKEGLSYSTWAGFSTVGSKTLLTASMGVTPGNIDQAVKGLEREINNFGKTGIKQRDVQRAINRLASKHLMRTLTRIGQAYYLGLNEFRGKDLNNGAWEKKLLEEVTAKQVQEAAGKYLNTRGMVTVIVE